MLEEFQWELPTKNTAVTIGVFDGVHLGHQALLRRTQKEARTRGLVSVAVTFRNHPGAVLSPSFKPSYLMDLDNRLQVIRLLGIEQVIAINFTKEVSQLSPRTFAQNLKDRLGMKLLVVGPDFALGKNREGDVKTLSILGRDIGYEVLCEEFVQADDRNVSSTVIREALSRGDVSFARKFMANAFKFSGNVVLGEKRGRMLGFPTANIEVDGDRAIPGDGIYATKSLINGRSLQSISYIGNNPTFNGDKRTIEVHLLDFNQDIYGQLLSVEFIAKIRSDIRFSNTKELVEQMNLDVSKAREILAEILTNG